jgi:hypothetical protein
MIFRPSKTSYVPVVLALALAGGLAALFPGDPPKIAMAAVLGLVALTGGTIIARTRIVFTEESVLIRQVSGETELRPEDQLTIEEFLVGQMFGRDSAGLNFTSPDGKRRLTLMLGIFAAADREYISATVKRILGHGA